MLKRIINMLKPEPIVIDPEGVWVDVRTPSEFAGGSIDGATNLPLQAGYHEKILPCHFETPVYVFCAAGPRASAATRQLKSMGYNAICLGGISKASKLKKQSASL